MIKSHALVTKLYDSVVKYYILMTKSCALVIKSYDLVVHFHALATKACALVAKAWHFFIHAPSLVLYADKSEKKQEKCAQKKVPLNYKK